MDPPIVLLKCILIEGNYSTTTRCYAFCDIMNAHYPYAPLAGTFPQRFEPHANVVNITISIYNGENKFEIMTDEQVLVDMAEEGLVEFTRFALSMECQVTPNLGLSTLLTTAHQDMLICILTVTSSLFLTPSEHTPL